MTVLSLRRLWTIYKRTAIAQGTGANKRDLALAQVAFYSGARGVLKVLDHNRRALGFRASSLCPYSDDKHSYLYAGLVICGTQRCPIRDRRSGLRAPHVPRLPSTNRWEQLYGWRKTHV